jgi:hypothetical protein
MRTLPPHRLPAKGGCIEIDEITFRSATRDGADLHAGNVACMKISAIASRGTKRDFVDLYASAQRWGLAELLRLFNRKYAQTAYRKIHVLKSLTFFEDAEKDPMPVDSYRLE